MTIIDQVNQLLGDSNRVEFSNTPIEIPLATEEERTMTYDCRFVATQEAEAKSLREQDIPGNSYGAHGQAAEENVPDDFEWYAWCTSSGDRIADVWLYGYFDSEREVLVRNETSMAHRTAAYYWVAPESFTILND